MHALARLELTIVILNALIVSAGCGKTTAPKTNPGDAAQPAASKQAATPNAARTRNGPPRFVAIDGNTHRMCALTAEGAIYCWGEMASDSGDGAASVGYAATRIGAPVAFTHIHIRVVNGSSLGDGLDAVDTAGAFWRMRNAQWQRVEEIGGLASLVGKFAITRTGTVVSLEGEGKPIAGIDDAVRGVKARGFSEYPHCFLRKQHPVRCVSGDDETSFFDAPAELANATDIAHALYGLCATVSGTWKCVPFNRANPLRAPLAPSMGQTRVVDTNTGTCLITASNAKCDGASITDWRIDDVAFGEESACALGHDGTVRCWGLRTRGTLGDGSQWITVPPAKVAQVSGAREIVAGLESTCARTDSGVWCWGAQRAYAHEMHFRPPTLVRDVPELVSLPDEPVQLGSTEPFCIEGRKGGWRCRRQGFRTGPWLVPHAKGKALPPGTRVWAGHTDLFARDPRGVSWAWHPPLDQKAWESSPIEFERLWDHPIAAASRDGACMVDPHGDTWCACEPRVDCPQGGKDSDGIRRVELQKPAALAHTNNGDVCAILSATNLLQCMSTLAERQPAEEVLPPARTDSVASLRFTAVHQSMRGHETKSLSRSVRAGGFACALTDRGEVHCWGSNAFGQLGRIGPNRNEPIRVEGIPPMSALALGAHHACGIARDGGAVHCWGSDRDGQCGTGRDVFIDTPRPIVLDDAR